MSSQRLTFHSKFLSFSIDSNFGSGYLLVAGGFIYMNGCLSAARVLHRIRANRVSWSALSQLALLSESLSDPIQGSDRV